MKVCRLIQWSRAITVFGELFGVGVREVCNDGVAELNWPLLCHFFLSSL